MTALKRITLHNIQSHVDTVIDLPETGLVVFFGDNSNGKSVVRKALEDIIAGNISRVKTRKSLIRLTESSGTVCFDKYDGSQLFINLDVEASRTWMRYTPPTGEPITRYLADKSMNELIHEFGFHYNSDRGISLNLCDGDDSILFFRTSHVTNGDILNSALIDSDAQSKYEVLKSTYQEAITLRKMFNENVAIATAAREALVLYDIDAEQRVLQDCNKAVALLSNFYLPNLRECPEMLSLPWFSVPAIRLQEVCIEPVISVPACTLQPIEQNSKDLLTVMEGVCPVCQRPFSSHQTCTKEM